MVNERRIQMAGNDERIAEELIHEARGQLIPELRDTADHHYYTDLPYKLMPASIFGGPAETYRAIRFGTPQNVSANLALQVPIYDPAAFGAVQIIREDAALGNTPKRARTSGSGDGGERGVLQCAGPIKQIGILGQQRGECRCTRRNTGIVALTNDCARHRCGSHGTATGSTANATRTSAPPFRTGYGCSTDPHGNEGGYERSICRHTPTEMNVPLRT